ncbi:acyl-CoA dehydrogenase family protein [Mycolicibacterium fortuitum]|uniref:Acyl-CoA dehydrogenase family protein n=2 Tax=Mycolicibacterium fortuitum TaxID=1766 RepID=A0AAE4VHF4_MYCFO|nr:acyl-CoA dehydrogenase family protein [Mycolicibacterium fortuitum]MCV7140588.1 acyl-CoA dehydrogenase [Mycolicibacterium fortuitum]MDV7195017.1 acyl-CoA dehydrogenase family protein [Mycolicibacterium fortuitum]MDV7208706.1 acyl-CoA dehydrogenase family protein [Mycolicibacterium fortuitum]MDV7230603.1 acyl-CoA dehydrogenase family protein [Mycolicibacterium fortuitum]MDV7262170.1 acyl-CoA dehydrogenase family protein [Mycolicibacterium fortuitum]
MDVRLTSEQRQLREAAAKLADDLGPDAVGELSDEGRNARLESTVAATEWRTLRSDGASGVEVAIIAEEFGRGLVDVPFLGPVLADDLGRRLDRRIELGTHEAATAGVDLTRSTVGVVEVPAQLAELSREDALRWQALALAASSADLVGAARGAHALAVDYAKVREQYGSTIGSYQAVAHLLAEGLALIEGSISVLRHAAWAVDELPAEEAVRAGKIAKIYCARAARTVCETAIQVHGGIGNTWECLAHVYLRRVLVATELWPVKLEELEVTDLGLS